MPPARAPDQRKLCICQQDGHYILQIGSEDQLDTTTVKCCRANYLLIDFIEIDFKLFQSDLLNNIVYFHHTYPLGSLVSTSQHTLYCQSQVFIITIRLFSSNTVQSPL